MSESNVIIRDESPTQIFNSSLPITKEMLQNLKDQRALLAEFVSSQLRKEIDYGIVPGAKKPSLFKPGAEKIRGLFGLAVKLECTLQKIDGDVNFAMFTYKARVFRGEILISECEGSTNSQEKKFKERTVWRFSEAENKKVPIHEVTPIYDILNTLQKMAQKRAFVGAIIIAVGASDFFTQDIDDLDDAKSLGVTPDEQGSKSTIPNVINVSSKPIHNHQSGPKVYEAIVSYEDRETVRDKGFRWNAAIKKWTKSLTSEEVENGFPFEVQELK